MKWTPTDTGQLLILAMVIFASYCIVRGMVVKSRRKREEGGPCN